MSEFDGLGETAVIIALDVAAFGKAQICFVLNESIIMIFLDLFPKPFLRTIRGAVVDKDELMFFWSVALNTLHTLLGEFQLVEG